MFISKFAYSEPNQRNEYLKEDIIQIVNLKSKKTISLLTQPKDVENFYPNLPMHNFNETSNLLVNLFPCYDSIDVVNFRTMVKKKVFLNNLDFTKSEKINFDLAFRKMDAKYITLYNLKNFHYTAVICILNAYYFFYNKPLLQIKPTENDIEQFYIKTDSNFKILSYNKIGKGLFFPSCYLKFNNKIFLPYFKTSFSDEKPLILYNICM